MHCDELVAPYVVEYLPDGQFRQVEDEDAPISTEYLPRVQSIQVLDELAPVDVEYLPLAQSVHTLDTLFTVEYLPDKHFVLETCENGLQNCYDPGSKMSG